MVDIAENWRHFSVEELNRQYSPSVWNKRMGRIQVQDAHIKAIESTFQKTVDAIPAKLDVEYGPTARQKMDIFQLSDSQEGKPIFVFIHGGYWQAVDKRQGGFCVVPLVVAAKCTVISIGYDLAPSVDMHTIVNQVQNAGKQILQMAARTKASGVYFSGHCAGAHLATLIATADWLKSDHESRNLIKGFVLISGLFDLRPLLKTENNDLLKLADEAEAERHSPIFHMETIVKNLNRSCRFIVTVADNDSPEFHRQSEMFANALKLYGFQVICNSIADVDHFNILENLVNENFSLMDLILSSIRADYHKEPC